MPSRMLFSRSAGLLLAAVFVPVSVDQSGHSEIDLSLDVQVPVFVARRHLLALDLLGQLV